MTLYFSITSGTTATSGTTPKRYVSCLSWPSSLCLLWRLDLCYSDGLRSYGWLQHDGTRYGSQSLIDPVHSAVGGGYNLTTEWIQQPDATGGKTGALGWVARISGRSILPNEKRYATQTRVYQNVFC
jgi:hypothetical protein